MLIVRNESTIQDLVIDHINISNGDSAISQYDIHIVTTTYVDSGTAVVGVNLNTNFGNVASKYTATGDEINSVQGGVIMEFWAVLADTTYRVDLPCILKNGTAIGVDQITEAARGTVQIFGYFVDKE